MNINERRDEVQISKRRAIKEKKRDKVHRNMQNRRKGADQGFHPGPSAYESE